MRIGKKAILLLLLACLLSLCACGNSVKRLENVASNVIFDAIVKDNEIEEKSASGLYSGDTIKKVPEGSGVFISENSDWRYEGEFLAGKITGVGIAEKMPLSVILNAGGEKTTYEGIYSGALKDGLPDGNGIFVSKYNDVEWTYGGQFSAGVISGNGMGTDMPLFIMLSNRNYKLGIYTGKVVDGYPDGEGTFKSKNSEGVSYEYYGAFSKKTMNGYGRTVYHLQDMDLVQEGNYVDAIFTPTQGQMFRYLAPISVFGEYEVSDEIIKFIDSSELFKEPNKEKAASVTLQDFDYKKFKKNKKQDTIGFVKLTLTVTQIFEEDLGNNNVLTSILAHDNDYNYYVVYHLSSVDIYEDDKFTTYAVPCSSASFENVSGGTTLVLVFLSAYITK